MELFIYLFAALFSVLNPIGTVPIFVALTEGYTQNQESNAILRQKNNLKLYYENNLQKTKSKP